MSHSGLRILCADDNLDVAETMAVLMVLSGAEVRVCYDGSEALSTAEKFQPNVAILDLNMPHVDGCAVARLLRASAGDRPLLLIAVTAAGDDKARSRTAAAGFDHHLTKPADPAALTAILDAFAAKLSATQVSASG